MVQAEARWFRHSEIRTDYTTIKTMNHVFHLPTLMHKSFIH